MSIRPPLCDLLGIAVPIGNAGMAGGTAGPALAAAVAEAGGLGGLGGIDRVGPDGLRARICETRRLTSRPFSVNLWVHLMPIAPAFLDVCIEERVPSITFSFGDPAPYVGRAHDAGILVLHQAQRLADVQAAAAARVDAIIAQGGEAGGHSAGNVSTMAFVPAAVDAAGGTPVIATGGIADGRGLVAALALGAQGVIMGTRFVAATEATPPEHDHQQRILAAGVDDTVFSDTFDIIGGLRWPEGIAGRTIRSPFTEEWYGRSEELRAQREAILAESPMPGEPPERAYSAYAGQSAGLVHDVRPAAQIIRDVMAEAEAVLGQLSRTGH